MRLIDADELIKQIEADAEHIETPLAKMFLYANISDIKHAPTIAQPKIIRCRDCRYWDGYPSSSAMPWLHECHARIARLHTAADEFCSRAERREVSE